MSNLLSIFLSISFLLSVSACTCSITTLPQAYAQATTVVRARVIAIKLLPTPIPPPCLTGKPSCLIPIRLYEPVKYTFVLRNIFKGCGPMNRPIFYGMTTTNSAACGLRLKKRATYLLSVDVERPCGLDGFDKKAFSLNLCQFNPLWKSLNKNEKRFLNKSSRKNKNQCMA